jgi:hypothetical protein
MYGTTTNEVYLLFDWLCSQEDERGIITFGVITNALIALFFKNNYPQFRISY